MTDYTKDLERQNEHLKQKLAVFEKDATDCRLMRKLVFQILRKVDAFSQQNIIDGSGHITILDIDGTRVVLEGMTNDEYNMIAEFIEDARIENSKLPRDYENVFGNLTLR
jgi:hypothetical protein